jgi:hypothetical protein
MILKKIGHKLGLTKRNKKKLSEILYSKGIVISKSSESDMILPQIAQFGEEDYSLVVECPIAQFNVRNKNLFNSVNIGSEVLIAYQEINKITSNYVSPNFNYKKELDKVLLGYKLESARAI